MSARYSITIDRARKLLRIEFSGFFGLDDLVGYLDAKSKALADLGCRPNDHVTLCDFSACTPQSAEVLAMFQQSLDDPRHRSRRLAVVVSTALAGMQARRVVTRTGVAFFQAASDAERWLLEGSVEGAPATPGG